MNEVVPINLSNLNTFFNYYIIQINSLTSYQIIFFNINIFLIKNKKLDQNHNILIETRFFIIVFIFHYFCIFLCF